MLNDKRMKKIKLFQNLLLFSTLISCNYVTALPDNEIVVQQIRYYSTESEEAYLVWGINDWKLQDKELRPEGSFIKENMLHTPMKLHAGGIFMVNLKVRPKTQIDYRFRITKGLLGKEVDTWDSNRADQKDYHTIVLSDNVVLINSKVKVRPEEALSILDFSMPFLSISSTLLLLIFLIKLLRYKEEELLPDFVKIILSGGLILFVVLALIRSSLIGFSWELYIYPFRYIPKLIWAGFYDLIYIGIICGTFLILNMALEKFVVSRRILISFFVIIGIGSVLSALLNTHFIGITGMPFSYQSLFLTGEENLFPELTFEKTIQIISVCCSCVFSGIFFSYLFEMLIRTITVKRAVASSIVCAGFVYFTIAPNAVLHYSWDYEKLANPVVGFFENEELTPDKKLFSFETTDSLQINISKNTGSPNHSGMAPE